MTKKSLTLLEQITQAETKIKQLVEQRHKELLDVIAKSNALNIDNALLRGFLNFANNPANKSHHMLQEFRKLGTSARQLKQSKV